MGKLVRLELYNFKSYKGHHVLLFGDSYFTSIIGPNGSGKSNSMDAISFVLGIKSSHLRSSQLKDLIYRGRVYRTSKINADGTATEVADGDANGAGDDDTQQSTQQDQVKGAWVMAVYEDDAGDEQKWKRTITNSGASEYRVNDKTVTAKQYNEILEAENILVKARNFLVFQGDVEAIAQQSPKDLTRLIEQISGSLEYKEEYDRLKQEAEKANEEQSFKLNQRRAMNSEIKQYQDQKKEAEAYERKLAERDDAIVTHVLWRLFHFQKTITESQEEIEKHRNDLQEFERSVSKYRQRFDDAQRDQAKATREVSKVQRNIERKEKEIAEKENSLVPVDEKISISTQNLARYQARIADIDKDRSSQQATIDQLKRSISTVEKAQDRWEQEWQKTQQQQGRILSATDFRDYNRLRGDVTKRTAEDQSNLDSVSRQLRTNEETVNSLQSRVEMTEAEIKKLNEDISTTTDLQKKFEDQAKTAQKDIDRDKKQINALASERVKSRRARDELEEKLQQALRKLLDADDGRRMSEREQRARETVNELKRLFGNGVLGRVHELCKPKQRKFETAVGVVLGRHFDSIVTESEKVAQECIQYLKDKRVAPTTFLPLDTIQVSAINPNLKGMHKAMRLAVDTIDYDNSVERAMNYVCGSSIVCDTMEVAKHLCYERRVDVSAVTLDGTKFSKGGVLTGGQGAHDKPKRWDDNEVEALRRTVDKLKTDIQNLDASKSQRRETEEEEKLKSDLAGAESRLQYARDELKSLARNLESKRKESKFKTDQLADMKPRYEEQRQGVENLKDNIQEYRDAISEVEDEVFAEFCERTGFENIREYEIQQGSQQEEALQKRDEFTKQKVRLQSQLEFENKRLQATADRISKLRDQSKRDEQAVATLESEKEEIQSEVDALNAELEQLTEALDATNEKANEAAGKVAETRRELSKRSKHVDEKQAQIGELTASVQRAAASRYALLRKCRMDDIKIPLTGDSEPLTKLPLNEMEKDEDEMDVDNEDTSPEIQDYGIEVDFDELDDKLQKDDSPQAEEQLEEKISTILADLEKMAPNMRATDRLEGVEARARNTEAELTTARKSATKTREQFEKVKTKRLDLFRKAFKHISDQIDPVYKDLTKGLSSTIGGQAYLDEEDPEEPFSAGIKYHAMPPLKRFRDMEHLSGGEKTMAALALLFAVHSYQPSPFFVLDEVDAALDNANVGKLLGYIRRNSGPGMQFIVISLKAGLFEGSETLVGVLRDQGVNSSKCLTLDLRKYQP